MESKKAIILFSGGLDSTTVLHHALSKDYKCIALIIDYNQRHIYEIESAKKYLKTLNIKSKVFKVDLTQVGGSALTDNKIEVPVQSDDSIPTTYVPARNTIFLSIASAYAEMMSINDIFIGVNQIDYSGYPDCRPEFINSFENTINLGTKFGVEGGGLSINTPLINMSKKDIIQYGNSLGIDYSSTVSCYNLDSHGRACGTCDSCEFRRQGFELAGIKDPTHYKN